MERYHWPIGHYMNEAGLLTHFICLQKRDYNKANEILDKPIVHKNKVIWTFTERNIN